MTINPKSQIPNPKQIQIIKIQNSKKFWSFNYLNLNIIWRLVLGSWNLGNGFTLVELLVVITLIGLIGVILTEIFVLGFRSQGKTEILKEVKQNGDYAISVIEGMVRNAVDIPQNCNTNASSLTIVNPDRFTTTFSCDGSLRLASVSGGFPAPTPTISLSLTSNRVAITSCTFKIVCPTPPTYPKYVYVNFAVSQTGGGQEPESRASLEYQTTVSLWTYK